MDRSEAVTTTWCLIKDGQDYELEIICRLGRRRKSRKIVIGPRRAERWIEFLKSTKISIFPKGGASCDGSYSELTTGDQYASLSLKWHNVPPEGAEALGELEEALWAFVTPELEFEEEDLIPQPILRRY